MPEPSRTIRLELDRSDGLLRGRVAEAGRADQEFEGWLGLLTVLGAVLDGPVPPPSTPDPQERSR
jgi:hypothetical protein